MAALQNPVLSESKILRERKPQDEAAVSNAPSRRIA